jgi:hypothetical protein
MIQIELNRVSAECAAFGIEDMLDWLKDEYGYHYYEITATGRLKRTKSIKDAITRDIFCLIPSIHADRLRGTQSWRAA